MHIASASAPLASRARRCSACRGRAAVTAGWRNRSGWHGRAAARPPQPFPSPAQRHTPNIPFGAHFHP